MWLEAQNLLFSYSIDSPNDPILIDSIPVHFKTKIYQTFDADLDIYYLINPLREKGLEVISYFKENGKWQKKTSSILLLDDTISCFHLDDKKYLWAGTDRGLVELNLNSDKESPRLHQKFNGQPVGRINGIVPVNNEKLLIGTASNGIFYFQKDSLPSFTGQIYRVSDDQITPFTLPIEWMHIDEHENIWLHSPGRGIFFTNLKKRKFATSLQNLNGIPTNDNYIKAMTEDSLGRIWCLTRTSIKVIDENGNSIQDDPNLQFNHNLFLKESPHYIYCDHGKRILVATKKGLYEQTGINNTLTKIPFRKDSIQGANFSFLTRLTNNMLLASTIQDGLKKVTDFNSVELVADTLLQKGAFTKIFQNSKEEVFICEEDQNILVFHLQEEQLVHDTTIAFVPRVTQFLEDKKNQKIWLSSSEGLFSLKKMDGHFYLQKDTFFTTPSLNGMLQDTLGRLWISTNKNIIRYNPISKKIRTFHLADGLQAYEFNFWAALKTKSGKFIFGGNNGINIFNPYKIQDIETPANPTITEIKINGELPQYPLKCESTGALNISEIQKLTFKHWENNLTFDFAALEYSDPTSNQFSYQLVGVNDTFVEIGNTNTVLFGALSPDNYTLLVDATNSDGAWSKNYHKLEFRIKPPWYQSTLAYLLYILTTIILIYVYYRYRIRQIRKEEAFKLEVAQYKQLAAETETAVLRLQMNPHFIFNSMNSISSYIAKKDIDTANDYLQRFAKLMRMILKFAARPSIAVSEEIDLLQQYLQTEAMRFEKKFSYDFELGENFEPDEHIIPTMILQPFVENAILHGLLPKKGEGKILVRFWEEKDRLKCNIADNGIGRAASAAAKSSSSQHESKALAITKKRLEMLPSKNGVKASFKIIDLKDDAQNALGTSVEFEFPLI